MTDLKMQPCILVVHSNPFYCNAVTIAIQEILKVTVDSVDSAEMGMLYVSSRPYQMLIIEAGLEDFQGLDLVVFARKRRPSIHICAVYNNGSESRVTSDDLVALGASQVVSEAESIGPLITETRTALGRVEAK